MPANTRRREAAAVTPAYAPAIAIAIAITLAASLSTAADAQVAAQRLTPDAAHSRASFGARVDISGSQLFVRNNRAVYNGRCCTKVIEVYDSNGESWEKSQVLTQSSGAGPLSFATSAQHLVISGDDVRSFRNVDGVWEENQLVTSHSINYEVQDVTDDLLLLRDGTADSLDVYAWNRDRWISTGDISLDKGSTCASRGDILKVIPTPLNPTDAADGVEASMSVLTLRLNDDAWSVVDTLIIPETERAFKLVCSADGTTAAVLHRSTASILDRTEADKWALTGAIRYKDELGYAMDIEITKNYFYASEEFGADFPDGYALNSHMVVWSRRLGSWERVRRVEPLSPFDISWEHNDGCIGYNIAANDEYVVAGAPARDFLNGDERARDVGEVYVFANALLDNRPIPIPIDPRYELEWSSVYPSPGRGITRIEFSLPETARVVATVYDILGREVMSLEDGAHRDGPHRRTFDTRSWASGLYFVRVSVNDRTPAVSSFVVR